MRLSVAAAWIVVPLSLIAFAQTPRQQAFSLSVSPESIIIPAGSNATLTVRINRTSGFSGAITVNVGNLPAGVRAAPLTVAANATQGTLSLSSNPTTLPGGPVRVSLRGVSGAQNTQTILRLTINPPGTQASWLERLNQHRALANLPPVSDEPAWSDGCYLHTRYMIKNQQGDHTEDRNNRWFSPEGQTCAQSANLSLSSELADTDQDAVDGLMTIPFHGIGMIDPALARSAFASYREDGRDIRTAAALDVIRGLGKVPQGIKYPVRWPDDGKTVPFTRFGGGEWPDPLLACPGYKAPAGLPILFLAPPGEAAPKVTASGFVTGTRSLEHCVFTQATYKNPRADELELVQSILKMRRGIVLIPKAPLMKGSSYTVSLTVDGQESRWSFTVSSTAR